VKDAPSTPPPDSRRSSLFLSTDDPHASPSSAAASRRARNNNQHRAADMEFATEIGQSLLGEVRRLQALLSTSEDALSTARGERDVLEMGMKQLEESVERYKEENWNLEVAGQELRSQLSETTGSLQKSDLERVRTIKELAATRNSLESTNAELGTVKAELDKLKTKHDTDLASMRKMAAGLQRDKSDLQSVLEGTRNELETERKKLRTGRKSAPFDDLERTVDDDEDGQGEEEDMVPGEDNDRRKSRRKTGEAFVPPSPSAMEFDDEAPPVPGALDDPNSNAHLRSTLAHAQRTIATLRNALGREKEARQRLERASVDSSEDDSSPVKRSSVGGRGRGSQARRRGAWRAVPSKLAREVVSSDTSEDDEEKDDIEASMQGGADDEEAEEDESLDTFEARLGLADSSAAFSRAPSIQGLSSASASAKQDVVMVDSGTMTDHFEPETKAVEVTKVVEVPTPVPVQPPVIDTADNGTMTDPVEPEVKVVEVAPPAIDTTDSSIATDPVEPEIRIVEVPAPIQLPPSPPPEIQSAEKGIQTSASNNVVLPVVSRATSMRELVAREASSTGTLEIATMTDPVEPEVRIVEVPAPVRLPPSQHRDVELAHKEIQTPDQKIAVPAPPATVDLVEKGIQTLARPTTGSLGTQTEEPQHAEHATITEREDFFFHNRRLKKTRRLTKCMAVTSVDAMEPPLVGIDRSKPPQLSMPPPPSTPPPANLSAQKSIRSRPTSPPPRELIQRAKNLSGTVFNPAEMPPPPISRPRAAQSATSLRRPATGDSSVSDFGVVSIMRPPPTAPARFNTVTGKMTVPPRERGNSVAASMSSVASSRTSEPSINEGPLPALPTTPGSPAVGSSPEMIHAITQTMIGEFMFKYTRRKVTKGISEKRHERFFWVHPYTKTLYWSSSDPGAQNVNQSSAKSGTESDYRADMCLHGAHFFFES
jgi:predicted  nucleic acid-binding Zn-ribbon protein